MLAGLADSVMALDFGSLKYLSGINMKSSFATLRYPAASCFFRVVVHHELFNGAAPSQSGIRLVRLWHSEPLVWRGCSV